MSVVGHHPTGHSRHGLGGRHPRRFPFTTGSLVLVKWDDGMVYFAKIKRIDEKREKCTVVFDDKSQDEADFSQIHSVDETTTDIICIKCKKDNSDFPNEIVLCDMCGIGFHQKCHNPPIPNSALQLDIPWNCSYCQRGVKCPFLTESLDVLQNLLSDNEATTGEEDEGGIESEYYNETPRDEPSNSRARGSSRKRKGKRSYDVSSSKQERKSLRLHAASPESSLVKSTHMETRAAESRAVPTSLPLKAKLRDESGENIARRKRRRHVAPGVHHKRLKRSSVESRTVSVTRIDTPIYENGSGNFFSPSGSPERSTLSPVFSPPELDSTAEENLLSDDYKESCLSRSVSPVAVRSPKQRQLRVSLSLPDEAEKRLQNKDPQSSGSGAPSWENICSPERSPSDADCFSSPIPVPSEAKKHKLEEQHAPFVASPLPSTAKKQLNLSPPKNLPQDQSKKRDETSPQKAASKSEIPINSATAEAGDVVSKSPPAAASVADTTASANVTVASPDVAVVNSDATVTVVSSITSSEPLPTTSFVESRTEAEIVSTVSRDTDTKSLASSQKNSPRNSEIDTAAVKSPSKEIQPLEPDIATEKSPEKETKLVSDTVDVKLPTKAAQPVTNTVATESPADSKKEPQLDRPSKKTLSRPIFKPTRPPPKPSQQSIEDFTTDITSIVSSVCSNYLSSSKMDVGVQGASNSAAATINDVIIGSSKPPPVPTVQEEVATPAIAESSKKNSPSVNSKASSDVPKDGVVKDSVAAAKELISPAPSPTVVPSVEQMETEITKALSTRRTPSPPPPAAPVSDNSESTKPRPSVLVASAIAEEGNSLLSRDAPSSSSPKPGYTTITTSSAAPTPVITSSPQVRSQPSPPEQPVKTNKKPVTSPIVEKSEGIKKPAVSSPTVEKTGAAKKLVTSLTLEKSGGRRKCSPPRKLAFSPVSASTSPAGNTRVSSLPEKPVKNSATLLEKSKPTTASVQKAQAEGSSSPKPARTRELPDDVIITAIEPSSGKHSQDVAGSKRVTSTSELRVARASSHLAHVHSAAHTLRPQAEVGPPPGYVHPAGVVTVPLTHAGPVKSHIVRQLPPAAPVTMPPPNVTMSTQHAPHSENRVSKAVMHHPLSTSLSNMAQSEAAALATKAQQGTHPSSVTTTKPYAIVNALPAQSADISTRSAPVSQKPETPAGVVVMEGWPNSKQRVICMVSSAGITQMITGNAVTSTPNSAAMPPPPRRPPPPYSANSRPQTTRSSPVIDPELQSIQKKIGDAFSQSSEVMLISAFEQAWNKFQANDNVYGGEAKKEFKMPGASKADTGSSGHALVHQMSTKPRLIAPKPLSENVIQPTSVPVGPQYIQVSGHLPPQPQQQQQQQQQLVIQPTGPEYQTIYIPAAPGQQPMHVAGVYYPSAPNQSEISLAHMPPRQPPPVPVTAPVSKPQHRLVRERPLINSGQVVQLPSQTHATPNYTITTSSSRQPPSSSSDKPASQKTPGSKKCARCGKGATYLCSGCHVEWYCGRDCQLKSWAKHSDHCKA